jgi:hypothetical protein
MDESEDTMNGSHSDPQSGARRRQSARRYTPDLGPASQFPIPKELLPYIDKFLETPKAKEWGIKDRRDFIITIMIVQLAKIHDSYSLLAKVQPEGNKGFPVLIPNFVLRAYDDLLAGQPAISKVAWFTFKNSLVAHSVRQVLSEHVPEYRELVDSLAAGPAEIDRYADERRREKVKKAMKGQGHDGSSSSSSSSSSKRESHST